MKTAKERVLARYCDVQLVRDTGNSRYYILGRERGTSACTKVIGKISSATECGAWESAAATLEPESKEVTLAEVADLRVKAIATQALPVSWQQGTDGAFRVHVGGEMVFESTFRADMVAKLRELATPNPPELPDMIPVMLPVKFLANFSGTAWATRLYRNVADSCRDALAKARAAKPEPQSVSKPIEWFECLNEDSNTIWFAQSPMVRECRSLRWMLVSKLFDNRIQWVADHDDELETSQCIWSTIDEAKAAVQAAHDAIVREQKAGME